MTGKKIFFQHHTSTPSNIFLTFSERTVRSLYLSKNFSWGKAAYL
jgi:hypothetical protein